MKVLYTLITVLVLHCFDGQALANPCTESIQGSIAWDGGSDTAWSSENLETLCRGAAGSTAPGLCFESIMSGTVNWGGGTNWNPVNAVNLCQGSINANATVTCFQNQISSGAEWPDAIEECQPNQISASTAAPAPAPVISSGPTSVGLPTGSTFGSRTIVTNLGEDTIYRITCRDCTALYCQPGDEIISNGGSCELGVLSRMTVGKVFDGACAGQGCWIAMLGCKGLQFQPLDPVAARASIQATCIEK